MDADGIIVNMKTEDACKDICIDVYIANDVEKRFDMKLKLKDLCQ